MIRDRRGQANRTLLISLEIPKSVRFDKILHKQRPTPSPRAEEGSEGVGSVRQIREED